MEEWGQGDAPLGLPPPLGERGGHLPGLSNEWRVTGFLQSLIFPIFLSKFKYMFVVKMIHYPNSNNILFLRTASSYHLK
jgi:hypothetical protein